VRLIILALGLALTDLLGTHVDPPCVGCPESPGLPLGPIALQVALAIITVGATITTIQRILHVRAQAKRQTTSDTSTSPQS
jgi:hypothetical protein